MKRTSELLNMIPLTTNPYWIRRGTVNDHFHNSFHHHTEIQLEYIITGGGAQIIGNSYSRFKTDDLVLFGSGLPHLRRPDNIYSQNLMNPEFEVITLIFDKGLFSQSLLSIPDFKPILNLFEDSKRGITIKGETKKLIVQLLYDSTVVDGLTKIFNLLKILQLTANSEEIDYILPNPRKTPLSASTTNRLSRIYSYTLQNFKEGISIKEIASVANLSEHSFCRFFKQNFRYNFSTFMLELRINHASSLLVETDDSISKICFDSGFNNIANFNKAFKKIQHSTPSEYRKKYKLFRI